MLLLFRKLDMMKEKEYPKFMSSALSSLTDQLPKHIMLQTQNAQVIIITIVRDLTA